MFFGLLGLFSGIIGTSYRTAENQVLKSTSRYNQMDKTNDGICYTVDGKLYYVRTGQWCYKKEFPNGIYQVRSMADDDAILTTYYDRELDYKQRKNYLSELTTEYHNKKKIGYKEEVGQLLDELKDITGMDIGDFYKLELSISGIEMDIKSIKKDSFYSTHTDKFVKVKELEKKRDELIDIYLGFDMSKKRKG